MRISWVVLTGLAVVTSGCENPESSAPISQPIVAGTVNTGDPAIMEVLSFKGQIGARCTATLVTPRILVLAAHCYVETPGFQRFLFTGNDDRGVPDKDLIPIKTAIHDPQYTTPRQGHDFAIVVLETPLAVRPMRINRAPLEQARGKNVRYVGYGITVVGNPNSGGVKRHNTAPLNEVTGLLLGLAPNAHGACEGDSGGPLLFDDGMGEAIVGVGSFVTNPACLRSSYYQRLDTQLAWLDQQIQKYDPGGTMPPDGGAAADAQASGPDAGAGDLPPAPTQPDAQEADSAPPVKAPPADARLRDQAPPTMTEPEPPPAETSPPSGGCSYSSRPRSGAILLLALALLGLRRRR